VLPPVRARVVHCRMSLYVDDVGIFANPIKEESIVTNSIPDCFANANSLVTNLPKTEVFPIHYEGIDMHDLLTVFPARIGNLLVPLYLGSPLY
jgi:hypothetical protein